jgi:hypothetical protein
MILRDVDTAGDFRLPSDPEKVREELARLARKRECRIETWTPKRPTEWNPDQVISPESGMPFTKAGAWEFVAQLLESGHPLQEVEMHQPSGEKGYVMEVDMGSNSPKLYVKLQLFPGKVIGRSFHYSLR